MRRLFSFLIAFGALVVRSLSGLASDVGGSVFLAKVAPIVQKHCVSCHGGERPKGDLALDALAPDLGKNGDAWKSVMDRLIDGSMPPKGRARPTDLRRSRLRLGGSWAKQFSA